MTVEDVLSISRLRLRNISLSKDTDALIRVINLGVSDLYNRFNLRIKVEPVLVSEGVYSYELRADDVLMLLTVYDEDGNELLQSDVIDSKDWEWKLLNYRSFLVNNGRDRVLKAVYKAAPIPLVGPSDKVDLPNAFIQALLLYVAYLVNSTITSAASTEGRARGGATESDILYKRYLEECFNLENMGYKINLNTERLSIAVKGFI